jgi:dynein heavy chain
MSSEMEATGDALVSGRVPRAWLSASYSFVGSVGHWVTDLLARVDFFRSWIVNGQPRCFWMSGTHMRPVGGYRLHHALRVACTTAW